MESISFLTRCSITRISVLSITRIKETSAAYPFDLGQPSTVPEMKSQAEGGEEAQRAGASPHQTPGGHEEAFDEPDDELEEFDEIGGEVPVDAEVKQWSEDWDAAGWDDEDADDEFLERLQRELETFKTNYANRTSQIRKAA